MLPEAYTLISSSSEEWFIPFNAKWALREGIQFKDVLGKKDLLLYASHFKIKNEYCYYSSVKVRFLNRSGGSRETAGKFQGKQKNFFLMF